VCVGLSERLKESSVDNSLSLQPLEDVSSDGRFYLEQLNYMLACY